jgi:hypothetical protein
MPIPNEPPRQTLDFYAHCVTGILHQPLDLPQRAAIVAHLERVRPPLVLKKLRSEWAMKRALAATGDVLADPRPLANAHPRLSRPQAAQPS